MYENEMHIQFTAISQNEAFARVVASAFASQMNPTLEEITDIRTAVSEAVTNAIIHAYNRKSEGVVYMDASIRDSVFEITVRDTGKGISDVALAMQPFYTSMPNLERSGMGFSVMEAFMDGVVVESETGKGTNVIMRKIITGEATDA